MTGTDRSPRKPSATTDDHTDSTDTTSDAGNPPEFSGQFHWFEWHLKQALDARLPKIVWYPLYELFYGIPVFILAFIFYLIWWPVKYTAIVWVPLLALGAFMLV